MPPTDFSAIEQIIEATHTATPKSPELPGLPKLMIEGAPEPPEPEESPSSPEVPARDPDCNEKRTSGEEMIPQAFEVRTQQLAELEESPEDPRNRSGDALMWQARAAEVPQKRQGAGDLRKLGGAGKHSPLRMQALEEERRAIIATIRECASKLGATPSFGRMRSMTGITMHRIQRHFGCYIAALGACGLEPHGNARPRTMNELFEDWAEIVRKLGKVPTRAQYGTHSRNSAQPLLHRFHAWSAIPAGMRQYALEHGMESAWKDVMEITEGHLKGSSGISTIGTFAVSEKPMEIPKRTSFGDPLTHLPMVHAPTCENAVLFLFGAMANDLGFKVRRMQAAFPDCLAVRRVGENQWEDVKIELELMSRNFAAHGHDPKGCDLIVCWEHNWPECPLEVVELRKEIARIAKIVKE